MSCKIIINIAGQKTPIEISIPQNSIVPGTELEVISNSIKDSSKDQELYMAIRDAINTSNDFQVSYLSSQKNLIPNYSAEEIKQEYGVDLGKSISKVLLIEDSWVEQSNLISGIKAIQGETKEVYIVSKKSLNSFAVYAKCKDYVKNYGCPIDLQGIHNNLQLSDNQKYIKDIDLEQNKIDKLNDKINTIIKQIEETVLPIKELSSNPSEAEQTNYNLAVKLNQEFNKLKYNKEDLKEFGDNHNSYKKKCESLIKKLESKEDYQDSLEEHEKTIGQLNTKITENSSNIEFASEKAFLNDFLDNNTKYQKILSSEKYAEIKDKLYNAIQEQGFTYSNPITQQIQSKLNRVSDLLYTLPKDSFSTILKENNIKYNKGSINLLLTHYFGNSGYKQVNADNNNFMFIKQEDPYLDLASIGIDTWEVPEFKYKYKGLYVYSYEQNGITNYIYNRYPLHNLSKIRPSMIFSSEKELKLQLNSIFLNTPLSNNNLFLRIDNNGKDYKYVKDKAARLFYNDQILEVSTYPKGPNGVNTDITVEDFKVALSKKYNKSSSIFKYLQTPEDIYLFLSYSPINKEPSYDEDLKLAEDIYNSKKDYYKVINNSYKSENYSSVGVVKITNTDSNNVKKVSIESSTLLLNSIADVLNKVGVPTEIVTKQELAEISGSTTAKAFYLGGKIYLASGISTQLTALHEYTHVLLGLIRANNDGSYEQLISKFAELESSKKGLNAYKIRYNKYIQDMSKQDAEMYLYEEMFADKYAQYLMNTTAYNGDLNNIFEETTTSVGNSPEFNGISVADILKNSNSTISIFKSFSEQIRQNKNNRGYSLPLSNTVYDNYNKVKKEGIKNNLIQGECN